MKKSLITLLLLVGGLAAAKPVDMPTARRVAETLLRRAVVDATPATFTHCYLFTGADGKGFALIAGDDCSRPVLAYSATGHFFPTDSSLTTPHSSLLTPHSSLTQSLPQHIAHWVDGYQRDIAALAEAGVTSQRVQEEWQSLLSAKRHTPRDTAVAPLMTTTWNQGYPYYLQCPYSVADSAYSVTGCVATATAQVMKYWNHPAVGRGSHSYAPQGFTAQTAIFDTTHYDWDHMPDAPGWWSTDRERNAVAQLMHHVGIAVEMAYSPHSSGAFVANYGDGSKPSSENALKTYFRYNQGLFSVAKVDCSDFLWDSLITEEINASRPVLISGSDNDGGHAFVIDGYDSTGFFHVNWGWGGYCDGYYTLDSLNPDGSGIGGNATNGYNYNNYVLLHVYPASENATVTVNVAPSNPAMGSVSGGGTFASYANTTLVATAAEGCRFVRWKSGNCYNPFRFSPNQDITDTAIFARLTGDTLGYCFADLKHFWGEYAGTPCEWGIRIPASAVARHRQMEAVQLYGAGNAEYTVKVYRGETPSRMVSTATVSFTNTGWKTVSLTTPLPLYDDTPLWIVCTSQSFTNPACASTYSGNPDGSWYKREGTTWEHLENRGEYYAWMIRGVFGDLQPVEINAVSSNEAYGTVEGGGSYYPGDTALLTARPADGYRFVSWSNGATENPLRYFVTGPVSIIGSFLPNVGIDGIDDSKLKIEISGLELKVENPDGLPVELYDITGRLLSTHHSSLITHHFSTPGVYLLRTSSATYKIVAQ